MSTLASEPSPKRARHDESDSESDDGSGSDTSGSDSDAGACADTPSGPWAPYARAARSTLCARDTSGRAMLAAWESSLHHLAALIGGPPGLEAALLSTAADAEFAARTDLLEKHEARLAAAFENMASLGKQLRAINAHKAQGVVEARSRANAMRDGTKDLSVHFLSSMLVDTNPEVRSKAWTRVGTVATGVKSGCQHYKACMNSDCIFAAEDVLPRKPVALLNFHDAAHNLCLTLCERCITVSNVGFLLDEYGAQKDESGKTRGQHTADSIWELYYFKVRVATARLAPKYLDGSAETTMHDKFSLRQAAEKDREARRAANSERIKAVAKA